MFPELNNITVKNKPFEYFFGDSEINQDVISSWLDWLESDAPWELIETNFYEQYEFSLNSIEKPNNIDYLSNPHMLSSLVKSVERIFSTGLKSKVNITAHKLLSGQTIRIHNDFLEEEGAENYRVLLQLNRTWDEENGGYLMFFSDCDSQKLSDVVEPISGSIQGFKISPTSYHAVSTVHAGERYTIVYSFFKDNKSIKT